MKTSIVIPTYNEAENLPALLEALRRQGPELHILIVDDNSPDGTADIAAAYQKTHGPIDIMRRAGKLGLGTAYVQGFQRILATTDSELIVQMDADL